jgi:hypothetical protein
VGELGVLLQFKEAKTLNLLPYGEASLRQVGLRCVNPTYLKEDGGLTAARGLGMLSSYRVHHEIRRLPNSYVRKQLLF